MPQLPTPRVPGPARALFGVFGLVFAGAGVCMLALIWSGEADFVPTPARLFGTLICLAPIAMGSFFVYGAIAGPKAMSPSIDIPNSPESSGAPPTTPAGGYVCPNCGAALGEKADVSPMGDVKCAFCGRWFNVHRVS